MRKLEPQTRRWIVLALAGIATVGIVAEVVILLAGASTSEALLTISATAVGGIAGLAVPQSGGSDVDGTSTRVAQTTGAEPAASAAEMETPTIPRQAEFVADEDF